MACGLSTLLDAQHIPARPSAPEGALHPRLSTRKSASMFLPTISERLRQNAVVEQQEELLVIVGLYRLSREAHKYLGTLQQME